MTRIIIATSLTTLTTTMIAWIPTGAMLPTLFSTSRHFVRKPLTC